MTPGDLDLEDYDAELEERAQRELAEQLVEAERGLALTGRVCRAVLHRVEEWCEEDKAKSLRGIPMKAKGRKKDPDLHLSKGAHLSDGRESEGGTNRDYVGTPTNGKFAPSRPELPYSLAHGMRTAVGALIKIHDIRLRQLKDYGKDVSKLSDAELERELARALKSRHRILKDPELKKLVDNVPPEPVRDPWGGPLPEKH